MIVALSDRVRVEGERPREPLQIFFDNRLMGEFSGAVVMIWNDGLRVMTDALRLPEGTQVLDSESERETQTLTPRESPQLLIYPHGRLARVYCAEDGTVEMVFGDSPAALLNNTNACECGRKQSNEFDWTSTENKMREQALETARLAPCKPERIRQWLRDVFIFEGAEYPCGGTPAAWRATAALICGTTHWLRGEIDQFVMGMRLDVKNFWLAGVTLAPRVWTLRLCDILPEGFFRMTLWRDALPVDNTPGEIEEIFEGVTADDKPAVELARGGGFVARFEPCHETEFRMVKGERE